MIGPSIGQREVPIITDMVVPAIEQQGKSLKFLVLDLSQITFVNSMGLGMFIDFRNRANKAGAKSILLGMNQQLTDLFKMVKIEKLYGIAPDASSLQRLLGAS
jgi:anti-anti-sigma factor